MTRTQPDISDTARHWIVRMASGEMTEEELAQFREWRAASPDHNTVFEQERRLWRALRISSAQDQAVQASWTRMGRKQTLKTGLFSLTAIAASAAIFLYAPSFRTWLQADQWTGTTIQTVALTDGSEAILDSDTAIAIHYSAHHRDITLLQGNALFKIRHDADRPFRVTDQDGRIEDVGTVFEVRDAPEHVTVSVSQGLVDVYTPSTHSVAVRLREGERLAYAHGTTFPVERDISPDDIAAWSRGDLTLDNATLAEAVRAISRYRHGAVYVWGDAPAASRISGVFRIDQPDEALSTIAATSGMKIVHLPGHIVVLRRA
ncbi:FecR family protein [Gluconacetobacter sp. Hr-1-5]|uniref:FecR family protein n=1 Tax=Gluconacetobacter sp. Hr-1-5 TaxID=3395370 RepID=UPI003B52E284